MIETKMQINSVWHITVSGRSLRINSPDDIPSSNNAIVFTKKIESDFRVSEKIRIALKKTASLMKIRKYLVLSEKNSVTTGPFTIKAADINADGAEVNILINDRLYFLTFVPPIIRLLHHDFIVLIPASPGYFNRDDIKEVVNFLQRSSTKEAVLSGEFSKEWLPAVSRVCKCSINDDVLQNKLF